jgi:hypothetical protein
MEELYQVYLIKHKKQPFVMLDEMDLTFEQFVDKLKSSYVFNKMWGYGDKEASK